MTHSTSRTSRCCPGEPDRNALTVPVNISADASRRHRYSVGAGYATDTGVRGTLGFDDHRINSSGHTFSVEIQAAQVTRYSLQARYTIPVGDPAVENISMRGSIEQQRLADVTTNTQSLGPASPPSTEAGSTCGWSTPCAPIAQLRSLNGIKTDRLLVPELDIASVPKGYLGEPLFEHPLFTEINGSHATLGSNSKFAQFHVQAERVFNWWPAKWHLLLRGEIGATFAVAIQPAARRLPLLRRRRQQRARLRLQRAVAHAEARSAQQPAVPQPVTCGNPARHARWLHQGRRQGCHHRHGRDRARPAQVWAWRPSSTMAMPLMAGPMRPAGLLGGRRAAHPPLGPDARHRHRPAAVRAVCAAASRPRPHQLHPRGPRLHINFSPKL